MQDTPTTSRWLRRGFLGLPLALWALIATAATALAVAVFAILMGMTGTISTGDGIEITYTSGTLTTDTNTTTVGAVCSATATSTQIAVTATGLVPYNYCYVEVDVNNAGPEDAKLERVIHELNNDDNGLDVMLDATQYGHGNSCDTLILSGGIETVGFVIVIGEGAEAPMTYIMDPLVDGLRFVRHDMDDGQSCH